MNNDLFSGLMIDQDARSETHQTGLVRDLFLASDGLIAAAQRLLDANYHLEDISGLDTIEGILANYHFDHFETPGRIVLRVLTPRDISSIPSIAHIFSGAEWHERELSDFYDVVFEGNPNPAPLLLPEADVTAPLLKKENDRVAVRDLIRPGDIRQKHDDFKLFEIKKASDPQAKEAEI